jgi:cell division septation protein DedD
MKLKYYMRGLGIGIILTTLILTIVNNMISEDEIIKRATALGMTFADEEDDKLNEMLGNGETVTPGVTPGVTLTVSPSQTPTNKPTSEPTPTVEPSQAPTQAITLTPTKAPAPTMMPKPTATPKPTDEPKNEQGKDKKISFTITRGMGSSEVADVLVQAGVIKDAKDFNESIIKAGKASNIKVGEFKVKKDASYDEIIKLITSK